MISIPYGKQHITHQDIAAVQDVLQSDWLTQGPAVGKFEQAVSDYCGVKYSVAVTSATAALHIACLALDLGPDNLLLTSPNTFVASANCALYTGAGVDFVDIDPKTYNMSVQCLEEKLKKGQEEGKLPKIVVPVHFSGQSCDMEQVHKLAQQYRFSIIEDASHAIGGRYRDTKVGSCIFSDLTVFSFHPVKIITTGEGGLITTNRQDLYEKLLRMRSHGITRDTRFMNAEPHGPWYYEQIELGYNYRMTDIQAALGYSQLQQIDKFIERRHALAKRYNDKLSGLPIDLPYQSFDTYSAYHLYVIRLKLNELSKSRMKVFCELKERGIGVNVHYIPVHTQPYYEGLGFRKGDFPEAEGYYETAITLPLYYDLSDNDQDYVVDTLREVLL